MRSYIALLAQVSPCVSFHVIHACALVFGCLSVFSSSLYFFLRSFFHLFLMFTLVPDENSMKDPLCNSSFGSMVSLDYVTPDTECLSYWRRHRLLHMRASLERNCGQSKFHCVYAGPSFNSRICNQEGKTSWPQIWENSRKEIILSSP